MIKRRLARTGDRLEWWRPQYWALWFFPVVWLLLGLFWFVWQMFDDRIGWAVALLIANSAGAYLLWRNGRRDLDQSRRNRIQRRQGRAVLPQVRGGGFEATASSSRHRPSPGMGLSSEASRRSLVSGSPQTYVINRWR